MTSQTQLNSTDFLYQPFVDSTQAFFLKLLGCSAELTNCSQCPVLECSFALSGVIGFTGVITGVVVVGADIPLAFGITEKLLGERPEKVDDDVKDVIGEMTNIIGGGAKEKLSNENDIALGLPTVIVGKGHSVRFDSDAKVTKLCFTTPWGPMSLDVGLRQC